MSNLYPDESISVDKCWERLHANTLGRLILTDGQHVDVLPVLYAVASQTTSRKSSAPPAATSSPPWWSAAASPSN